MIGIALEMEPVGVLIIQFASLFLATQSWNYIRYLLVCIFLSGWEKGEQILNELLLLRRSGEGDLINPVLFLSSHYLTI